MLGFKKKKKKIPVSISEVSGRLRGFILDSQIQNGHEITELLGCSVISDDVAEREEEESDKRVETVSYLIPLLYAYSHTLSEGATEYQRSTASEEVKALMEDVWPASRGIMERLTMSVLLGAVSQLVDMGLLEIPRKLK